MSRLNALLERARDAMLPRAGPTEDDARFRLQLTAAVAWLGVAVGLATTPYSFVVASSTGILNLGATALFAVVGVAVKRGLEPRPGFWCIVAVTSLLFVLVPLGEPFDFALAAWALIFPMAATLFDGQRAGVVGLGVGALTLVGMVGASQLDVIARAPPDFFLSLQRIVALVLSAFVIALVSARMRARALADARDAARARTIFLASMSHEFRTPMNGVVGLAETMLERPRSMEDHEALQLIKRSGHQLLSLIDDIIDFARIDAGRLEIKPEPTELRRLVSDAVELTHAAFSHSPVAMRIDIPSEVPAWVRLDALRVRQVLTNLAANALKFTSTGEVVVAVAVEIGPDGSETLAFTVRDTGVGIPADHVARLFHPFEQAHGDRFKGSGLGLAISRQLVELMGGAITLDSIVGRGTRAVVRLPLVPAHAVALPEPRAHLPVRERARRTVLVVDDNEINLRVAMALVRRAGYEVRSATNGVEALQAMHDEVFDAVLMDCHMPEMDGFEATRRIRALASPASVTPIIAVTASALPEERELCMAAGMNACTTKPLTLDALERAFDSALSA